MICGNSMTKILLLPLGIGLAHVGRLIEIGRELQNKGVDVLFGAGGDATAILELEKLPYKSLPEFDKDVYEKKIKKGNPFVYTRKIIERFVLAELDLYAQFKPDLVVFDCRPTVKVSTKIAGIASISIINTDGTRFYDISHTKFPIKTTLIKFLPHRFHTLINRDYSQKFLKRIGLRIFQALLLGEIVRFSPTLIKLGYIPSRDPYQFFLGDLTLITDIPEFRPMTAVPDNVKVIGPIFWQAGEEKLPGWHRKINHKKIVYVTAGGTGDKDLFLKILAFLKDTNEIIVATTGNTLKSSEVKISYPNLYVSDYLPGDWVMSKAKLVIFTGGNSTAYQALTFGVPQICTPIHVDQEDNANQLERLGTGIIVNPYANFKKAVFLTKVLEVMNNHIYYFNAQKMKQTLKHYDGKKKAAGEIINFLKYRKGKSE